MLGTDSFHFSLLIRSVFPLLRSYFDVDFWVNSFLSLSIWKICHTFLAPTVSGEKPTVA